MAKENGESSTGELIMLPKPRGNGSSKGFTNIIQQLPGWCILVPSDTDPPPKNEVPFALSQGLEKWLKEDPSIRVRALLPIVHEGNTIAIHVWFDRMG